MGVEGWDCRTLRDAPPPHEHAHTSTHECKQRRNARGEVRGRLEENTHVMTTGMSPPPTLIFGDSGSRLGLRFPTSESCTRLDEGRRPMAPLPQPGLRALQNASIMVERGAAGVVSLRVEEVTLWGLFSTRSVRARARCACFRPYYVIN